ncbi:acyl-CoA thioesterase [Sporobolomyces koalae]|uniref:acyl-CoA thioesterase n=1 Tax=Sporobolomyces koalae TaxID=500713 RepID=UPI003178ED19
MPPRLGSSTNPVLRLTQVTDHLRPTTISPPRPTPRPITTTSTAPAKTSRAVAPGQNQFRYFVPFQSTWRDNDQYSHFNNVTYSQYFDSVTNEFLLNQCQMQTTDPIGLIVASETKYFAQVSYPDPVVVGLSIVELGTRKIVWRIGLFRGEYIDGPRSAGTFSHEGPAIEPQRDGLARIRIKRDEETGESVTAAAAGTMTHVFVERGGARNRVVDQLPLHWREQLERLVVHEP